MFGIKKNSMLVQELPNFMPEKLEHHLVHTDDDLGLSDLAAQQRLMLVLANFSEQKNTSTINQVKD